MTRASRPDAGVTRSAVARSGDPPSLRVLLLSMPLAALERPSLGLGLLKALLARRGARCDVRYLGLVFAEFIGLEDYLWLHGGLPYTAFAGDWTFTASLYGHRGERDSAYINQVLRRIWHIEDAAISRLLRIRAYCNPFLDHCMASICWNDYDIVGFTSTFEQNIASLALARRIKAASPETTIVFGGANWEGEMGQELHARFPFVDFVCSGEADESFPQLLDVMDRGAHPDAAAGKARPAYPPGIVHRELGRSVSTGPAPLVRDLDASPFPDFDDYFDALADSPASAAVTPGAIIETSRGCWWGAKHHCTFCGLNGGAMAFRSKSPERALAEIHHMAERYGARMFGVVDNILDMHYFRTLLPMLAEERHDMSLFYEVKANLTLEQVQLLAAAGVQQIQPGIESLSDHVLTLMSKGTTALQNIRLLKWCRELGVKPLWNLLYGFPGEHPSDYARMLPLLDAIDHLEPPGAFGPVRLDRFSPYHEDPAAFGIERVAPMAAYRHLYPFRPDSLRRIAYYFDFAYADAREPLAYVRPVLERAQRWMDTGPDGGLWLVVPAADIGEIVIVRDRPGLARRTAELDGWQAELYLACDAINSLAALERLTVPLGVPHAHLREFLDWCVAEQLMVTVADRYLSLAVHSPPRSLAVGASRGHVAAVA